MRSPRSPRAPNWWPASTPAASCSAARSPSSSGIGVLAVRKGGKLPPPVLSETYELEYGTATLEVPPTASTWPGRNIVDHRRRAGHRRHTGRHGASCCTTAGAKVTGAAVVLELAALGRPRRARTAAGQQLAHRLRRYPRSLAAGDERCAKSRQEVTMADDPGTGQAVQAPPVRADAPRRSRWRSPRPPRARRGGCGPGWPAG